MAEYNIYATFVTSKNTKERVFDGFHFKNAEKVEVECLDGRSPSVWGVDFSFTGTKEKLISFKEALNNFANSKKMALYNTDILMEGGEFDG